VPRWDPAAESRLAVAAIELFKERGHDSVTISDIAARAGLTRRSFFRHFSDKREVLFAGSGSMSAGIEAAMARHSPDVSPRDAALATLTEMGHFLLGDPRAQAVRQAIIDSSAELQERERTKLASIATSIANGLVQRGVSPAGARALGVVAVEIFYSAYLQSIRESNPDTFEAHMGTARLAIERFLAE
jgi:AcrR family transcriptional regulator